MENYCFTESFRPLNAVISGNRYITELGTKLVRDSTINDFSMIAGKSIKVQ